MLPLLIALLAPLSAPAATPAQTGDVALPRAQGSQAVPAQGLRTGRVGGLPAVFVEVRVDGVSVEGEPVLVLRQGQTPTTKEQAGLLRPVYDRLLSKVAARQITGARTPFVAVIALDARVEAGVLQGVAESARQAGVEQLAFMVQDTRVIEPWTAARPDGQASLVDAEWDVIVLASQGGFEIVEAQASLKARDLRGLACTNDACGTVEALPWTALERVLERLGQARGRQARVRIATRESDLPAAVLIGGLARARQHFDVVGIGVLDEPILGGGLTHEQASEAEVHDLSGRLEVVSATLPTVADDERVSGIPQHAVERAFRDASGRTRACMAQAGSGSRVDVRLEVDDEGQVSAATVTRHAERGLSAGECVVRVVRTLEFPPPTGPDLPIVIERTFRAED